MIVLFALLALSSSCIERYFPEEEDIQPGTLVVAAHLHNIPGEQSIQISRSVDLTVTFFNPEMGAYVLLERADGQQRQFLERESGVYVSDLDADFLRTGHEYRLYFITGAGEEYASDYELMHPAPEIDSIRYVKEAWNTNDPLEWDEGIRFFVDFEIEKDSGRYLRWEMEETYEIINPDYPTRMYGTDRRWYTLLSEDKTLHCWLTNPVPDIYTKDMATVGGSIYYRMPLNYVSGRKSRRLYEKYSLKVRQISLGENAFWYWSELAKNTQSGGELFSSQPALTPSNIHKLNDPEAQIIGYFSVAGATEKRILVSSLPEVDIYRDPYICAPGVMPMFLWRYPQDKLPFFVASVDLFGEFMSGEVRDECVDCRLYKRSTDQKPDYW